MISNIYKLSRKHNAPRATRKDLRSFYYGKGVLDIMTPPPRLIVKDRFGTHRVVRDPMTGLKIL